MKVGCYVLDLYCDNKDGNHLGMEFPVQYTHELGATCRKMAKDDGWSIRKTVDVCPRCSGIKPLKSNDSS